MQENLEGYTKKLKFGEYEIVDINDYSEEELLKAKNYLSKLLLMEKYKKGENITNYIEKVINEINNNESKYKGQGKTVILLMIAKILKEKLSRKETEKYVIELGGDKEMLQVLEEIREENRMIREEGREEGRLEEKIEMIKNMLVQKISLNIISKVSGLSEKEIEDLEDK